MVTRIKTDNFLNRFDYDIDLSKIDSGLHFITGPNGYGKTVLLKMMHCVTTGYVSGFLFDMPKIPFDSITFEFSEGHELIVYRTPMDDGHVGFEFVFDGQSFKMDTSMDRIGWLPAEHEIRKLIKKDIDDSLLIEHESDRDFSKVNLYYAVINWIRELERDFMRFYDEGKPCEYADYLVESYIIERLDTLHSLGILKDIEFSEENAERIYAGLSVVSPRLIMLESLESNIRGLELTEKKLTFNADDGIVVEFSDGTRQRYSPDILSKGETDMISMLVQLFLITKIGRTVLIDMPETFLHVSWQLILKDLFQKIFHMRDIRFVVATHSPVLINGMWDRTTDLFGITRPGNPENTEG